MSPKPSDILNRARDLVAGERAEQHGDFRANMDAIAAMWTAYTGHRFEARDVAWMMALVKIARERTGGNNLDNAVDVAGYAGIAGALTPEK